MQVVWEGPRSWPSVSTPTCMGSSCVQTACDGEAGSRFVAGGTFTKKSLLQHKLHYFLGSSPNVMYINFSNGNQGFA